MESTYEIAHWSPRDGHLPRHEVTAQNSAEALDVIVERFPFFARYQHDGRARGHRRIDPVSGNILTANKVH